MNHLPVAIGLLLCEQVVIAEKTRNATLVNCFGARRLAHFPGVADFHLIAWLADGLGEMIAEIVVQETDSFDEIFRKEYRLRFDDPLKDMRFTAHIRDCPVPSPGYYVISLLLQGELVAHRKILFHT